MGLVVSPLSQEIEMNNWKQVTAAAIVAQPAPAQAPAATGDAELAFALEQKLALEEIAPRDVAFAQSLLRGFGKYGSFTERQRPHAQRLVRVPAAPVVNPDAALAERLQAALPDLPGRDVDFAQSLLSGFQRYGSFTDRQRPHAERLAAYQRPEVAPAPVQAPAAKLFPNICATVNLNKFARFTVGSLRLTLKNDGSVIWVKWEDRIVGSIDSATCEYRTTRRYATQYAIDKATYELERIEADPLAAARENGVLTGRCSCCGRPLTDPVSIGFGIGPICRERGFGINL
jgi:hypothetical protein